LSFPRDVFGDSALVGDLRWAGTYGVSGDFIARDNCRQTEFRLVMEGSVGCTYACVGLFIAEYIRWK
jgi:hypothetical protein